MQSIPFEYLNILDVCKYLGIPILTYCPLLFILHDKVFFKFDDIKRIFAQTMM